MRQIIQVAALISLLCVLYPRQSIHELLELYNVYQPRNRRMLFAFSSDEDVAVNAVELLSELNCTTTIDDSICGKILFYFSNGLGSELHVIKDFEKLVEISKRIYTFKDLGGNSAQMALRAFKEGADVYLHSIMSNSYFSQLYNQSIKIPQQFLKDEFRDIHLVVNFNEGDRYLNVTCKHTNRLYLQNDKDNTQFPGLEFMKEEIKNTNPDVIVLGGFQLMNQFPIDQYERIVQKLMNQLPTDSLVHFEMGAFTDQRLFAYIIEEILSKVDSTGLNEQELQLLYTQLTNKSIEVSDINVQMNAVEELLTLLPNLTRIHFHSQEIQMICSDSHWDDIKPALYRSIQVGLIQAMKEQNDNQIDYIFTDFQELQSFTDIHFCWNNCCVAPVLLHPKPKRTCGLGDNIGATSLLYQLL